MNDKGAEASGSGEVTAQPFKGKSVVRRSEPEGLETVPTSGGTSGGTTTVSSSNYLKELANELAGGLEQEAAGLDIVVEAKRRQARAWRRLQETAGDIQGSLADFLSFYNTK
jgi:hypothetical protein